MYGRDPVRERESIRKKFLKSQELADANVKVFDAGYHLGETMELFDATYEVPAARLRPGHYRNITGNEATALGLVIGREARRTCRSCTRAIRSRRRPTSCTTWRASRASA